MQLIFLLSTLLLAVSSSSTEPPRTTENKKQNDDFRTQPGHKRPKEGDYDGRWYCPAKYVCKSKPTEIERWECLGRMLYSPNNTAAMLAQHVNPEIDMDDAHVPWIREILVTHDCSGVGWGNAMRGLYGAVSIATNMGRRLIVMYDAMHRMFLPPYGDHWDLGLWLAGMASPLAPNSADGKYRYTMTATFDFEEHGRSPGRYKKWSDKLKKSSTMFTPQEQQNDHQNNEKKKKKKTKKDSKKKSSGGEDKVGVEAWSQYEKKPLLNAGICGGERDMLTSGCLPSILRRFTSKGCLEEMHEFMLLIPFYYTLFRRPSMSMVKALRMIRRRLKLPVLKAGTEEVPGQWGLRTPGYYIYAMHFRRIPLGFEPLSAEVNAAQQQRQYRDDILAGFWETAEKNVAQAKKIAACRGEKLLIYFATDDVRLRAVATERLKPWGKVVWGLRRSEIGHISPQWRESDYTNIEDTARKLIKEGYFGDGSSGGGIDEGSEARARTGVGMSHGLNKGDHGSGEDDSDDNALFGVDDNDADEHGDDGGANGLKTVEIDVTGTPQPVATSESGIPSDVGLETASKSSVLAPRDVIIHVEKDPVATLRHGDMTLVEWWILANAQWLQSHSGTSFSDTAAGWGLGPSGGMERLDVVHGRNGHIITARLPIKNMLSYITPIPPPLPPHPLPTILHEISTPSQ